jgi:hypothetical protein
MRKILQKAPLIAALAFSQRLGRADIAPANPNLVPQEFTIDDGPYQSASRSRCSSTGRNPRWRRPIGQER